MTTVADPLSAGLVTTSVRARSLVRASRLIAGRLSGLFSDIRMRKTEKLVAAHFCQSDHSMWCICVKTLSFPVYISSHLHC